MVRLPKRSAPFLYAVIQAAVTTAVATAVAIHQLTGFGMPFLKQWVVTWCLAWLSMLPVVIFVAPVIHRLVEALTASSAARDGQ